MRSGFACLGGKIEALFEEAKAAGKYSIVWDAGKFASGVYYYRLVSGKYVQTRKLLLLK